MDNHGVSRSDYAQSRTEEQKEKDRKKLEQYLALVSETNSKRSENDFSISSLELTSKVLKMNPEYYTMWNYRRQILLKTHLLSFDPSALEDLDAVVEATAAHHGAVIKALKEEQEFTLPLLLVFPKCYWLWNHRLWTLEQASVILSSDYAARFWKKELELVGMMLTRDARNFHGWMYRRILIREVEKLEKGSRAKGELEYTLKVVMGVGGMKNYSAWHQRSVLIPRLLNEENRDGQQRMDALEDELELIQKAITTDPDDQSLWFYHRFLVLERGEGAIAPKMPRSARLGMMEQQIEELKELLESHPEQRYILKALVLYVPALQALRKEPPSPDDEDEDDEEEEVDEAEENKQILEWLETLQRVDPMRKGRYIDLAKRIREA
ncbi:hypothetical protein FPQ18DRAFT_272623 [Pyronema domesticum]|uniref:Geranylgeranyl transferase type-2 subunit alpha n=1 Tax=Pyronema omphalodes (strain CBS 100304) TaxID=1076935 RepID=U4LKS0_PYROM|nr:hypothetical protein FPQ18DRAFT_272623 [Pyronema domesticum]CCX32538.1 Similar to Geranylgeranyl transferase type-2 subunit alpha; acc. no. O94412 [Pyronema omphalodes CBS 100304]